MTQPKKPANGSKLIKLSYFYLKLLFTFVQLVLDDPVQPEYKNLLWIRV